MIEFHIIHSTYALFSANALSAHSSAYYIYLRPRILLLKAIAIGQNRNYKIESTLCIWTFYRKHICIYIIYFDEAGPDIGNIESVNRIWNIIILYIYREKYIIILASRSHVSPSVCALHIY